MIIKRIIVALGALAILVGLSQLMFASWWVDVLPGIVGSQWLAVSGIASILFGALLLIALAEKLVIMRPLIGILGIFSLASGVLVILNPEMARDLVDAIMLNRVRAYQVAVIVIGGVIRTVIGALLIWAVAKSPGGLNTPQSPRPAGEG